MYSPVDHRLAQLMAEAAQATGGDAPVPFRFSLPAATQPLKRRALTWLRSLLRNRATLLAFPPPLNKDFTEGFKPARTAEDEEKETPAKRSIMHIN